MSNVNPTIAVREDETLDWDAVDRCLKENIFGLEGAFEVSQYSAGSSNLTYAIRYPDREFVLRRPPLGSKPKDGHSMKREYRVIKALKEVYPAVPRAYYYTDDETVLGAEFYVMEKVPGRLIVDEIPKEWEFGSSDTRRLCIAVWDKLIELHQVDFKAIGLSDFGRPEGYIERQIKGWNRRFQNALTPDMDKFSDIQNWLDEKRPEKESAHCILHGDFKIDNLILDEEDPFKVNALLDWEISALGDPLMDLGNALAYWVQADDPDYLQGMYVQPSTAPGMLTREEILKRYSEKTGLSTNNFEFYLVYGYFRNAVIMQQIYYRYYHGQTKDQRFGRFRDAIKNLGEHCRMLISKSAL